MIDVFAGLIGAGTVATPAAALLARSMRGLCREARHAEQLAASLDAARYQANHDALTGLLNRAGFMADAEAMLADPGAGAIAVGLADLDRFKTINDEYGHDAGDRVLVAAAGELTAAAGERALVGRLGGDEFAIAVPAADADQLAAGLMVSVRIDQNVTVEVTASLGLAHSDETRDLAVLLRRADAAMYRAKSRRGGAIHDPRRDDDSTAAERPVIRTRDLAADELSTEVGAA